MTRLLRRLLLPVLAALLSVPLLFASAAPACACSCALSTTAEFAERADVIASGRVRDVDISLFGQGASTQPVKYTIALDRVFKGEPDALLVVHTVRSEASCGVTLKAGSKVFVFATRGSMNRLEVGLCDGTGAVTDQRRSEVVALLGEGRAVSAATADELRLFGQTWWPGLLVVAFVAAVVIHRRVNRSGP